MAVIGTFTKRMKRLENQEKTDVYQYDEIPTELRVQVVHIWNDSIGPYRNPRQFSYLNDGEEASNVMWTWIHNALSRELGTFALGRSHDDPSENCREFLLGGKTNDALDIIELSFWTIKTVLGKFDNYQRRRAGIKQEPDDAIAELNHRFREHGLGYQFEEGKLIKVDSQFVHSEVIKPALNLLHSAGFKGAEQEFLSAHEHYRHGRRKEALNDALKAFESTMKTICAKRKWSVDPNATANVLINTIFDNGLIPAYLASHFAGLRSAMEAGVPTLRNKLGGHGQGATPVEVPPYLVAYTLHLAAANIVMLVEAHLDTK